MHLHHLTITTGHSRRSWRHEIEPEALAASARLLSDALTAPIGGRIHLPVQPAGCELQVTPHGRCLLGSVWHGDAPIVTFGVASHSRCGAGLWRLLCSGARVTDGGRHLHPERAPQEPWCAVRLEAGIAMVPDVAAWLGDMERCIAWAWLDRLEHMA